LGADFAKAVLAAGHAVVASGRDTLRVTKARDEANELMAVKLDITSRAVSATVTGARRRSDRDLRAGARTAWHTSNGLAKR
jgi:NADP-dependent 3-hydroxy acid dehydrogenase YdfG